MECDTGFQGGLNVPQDKLDPAAGPVNTALDDISREESFNLIDFLTQPSAKQIRCAQPQCDSAFVSKSFVEDLAGLQPAAIAIPNPPVVNKKASMERVSLLPSHSRSPKRSGRHAVNRFNELIHNRSSTPESIASEMDPYTQWYQVMQNYYKQFYPGYDFGNSAQQYRQQMQHHPRHIPKSVVPLIQSTTHSGQHQQQPFSYPQFADYAAYYQYYLGSMAAANGWPIPMGRTTPKVFIEPHIRATLSTPGMLIQILPNRPQEGEPGRVELLDVSQLASDVVAEVGSRLTQVSISARKTHHGGLIFSNPYQESSEGPASTLPDNEEMEDDDVEEEYMRLVNAWDRADHVLYPGPLCQDTTLKHDVQAFLRGKVEDIQDRMPVDWDSASLLLAYLELLVKNNGIVHPGDVVNLLLGNESTRTYDYSINGVTPSASPFSMGRVSTLPKLSRHGSFHPYSSPDGAGRGAMNESSGRESPCLLTHASSTVGFSQQQQQQRSASASSTGGASVSRLLRKGLLADLGGAQEREAAALRRFRELLMHGHPLKALDQACQQQLWGHAFALAQRLGPVALERVMEKFLSRAVHPHDPLLTLYQLTAGEIPCSVDQLAYAGGADTGDWRPHLAMLLSAPEGHEDLAREALKRMGESLLARRLLFAAHLCFLLAASSTASAPPHMPSRIWLIGVAMPKLEDGGSPAEGGHYVMTAVVERAPTEAVQLTEIYEYALALATRDRHFFLPQFLPFKFAYCLRLIDAGFIERAFRYLEVLCNSLSMLLEQEIEEPDLQPLDLRGLFLMASQCLRLAERLCHHPEVGSFEASAASSNCLGGGSSLRSRNSSNWIERLRVVYQRMCSGFGLPNSECPYVDPVRIPLKQESEEQQPQLQQPEIQSTAQPMYSRQPSTWNRQPEPPRRRQQLQQNIRQPEHNQPPQIHHHQSTVSSDHKSVAADTHSHPQATIHDITSSPSPSFQPEISTANDTYFQKHELLQNQCQEPVTPHKTSISSSIAEQSVSSHQVFFVPSLNSSSPNAISTASETSGYDYFAGIASSQSISRSRTVSMASSHGSSTVASSPSPSSRTVSPSSSTLQPQMARRISNSGSLLRDQRSRNTASRSSPATSSSGGGVGDMKRGHSVFTTAPSQPPIVKAASPDNRRQAPEQSQLQQSQSEEKSGATLGKSGWFSGLFGRMRGGGQEIYLPDDSNPSIVWNEAAGCWQDMEGGNLEETAPPPPPPAPPSVPTAAPLPSEHTGAVSPPLPPTLHSSGGGGGSTRARYVNVLASSGGGTTKITTLTPPLPTPHSL